MRSGLIELIFCSRGVQRRPANAWQARQTNAGLPARGMPASEVLAGMPVSEALAPTRMHPITLAFTDPSVEKAYCLERFMQTHCAVVVVSMVNIALHIIGIVAAADLLFILGYYGQICE